MAENTFFSACELRAQVETNCPRGGDAGHGGVTRLVLEGAFGFASGDDDVDAVFVDIEVKGDAEAEVLADALVWAGDELRRQMKANPAPY